MSGLRSSRIPRTKSSGKSSAKSAPLDPPELNDLIVALTEASQASPRREGVTRRDLEYALMAEGWGHNRIMRLLHQLAATGRLGVRRTLRTDLCGRNTTVPVYYLK